MADRLPRGVVAAACTPIGPDGRPDLVRLVRHARRLQADGCVGVLVAGTTGEGSGFSLADRRAMVESLTGDRPAWPVFAATGTSSLRDTADLTRHAIDHGAIPVVLPPRVEGVAGDAGLVAWYVELIERAVPADRQIVLYNLPALSGVSLSPSIIEAVCARGGARIGGLKDSSADRAYLHEIRRRFPDLPLYVGHEPLLVDAIGLGACGALSGMANVFAELLVSAATAAFAGDPAAASSAHRAICVAWAALGAHQPYPAAFKGLLAMRDGDPAWVTTNPPIRAMTPDAASSLRDALRAVLPADGPWPAGSPIEAPRG